VTLGEPLPFREGRILAYPSQITDLLWARQGQPKNLMLVYEVPADEVGKPFYHGREVIFAPIELLPEHSFWRDNLPQTTRHAVAGGRRNVFRGDEIAEARRIVGLYLQATALKGKARWGAEIDAVSQALSSPVTRLTEDAVSWFSASAHLSTDFPDSARETVSRYLEGARPDAEKVQLIDALGHARVAALADELRKLGGGSGPVAAASMVALDEMGAGAPMDRVLELSKSPDEDVRAYAAHRLGADRSGQAAAFERTLALMDASQPDVVRRAAAAGLGWQGNTRAVEPLAALMRRQDPLADMAGEAIADIGGEEAGKALKDALVTGSPATAAAAVNPLHRILGCEDCGRVLAEQRTKHPDAKIRDLIRMVLELPRPHEH